MVRLLDMPIIKFKSLSEISQSFFIMKFDKQRIRNCDFITLLIVTMMVFVVIPSAYAELSISDDFTGGDCTSIGTWNSASNTCTLTKDVTEQIVINSDNVTLDGNNHLLDTSSIAGYAIESTSKNNIIIKNFKIIGEKGIELKNTIGSKISNNEITGAYKTSNYGEIGILVSAKDTIIENNIIRDFSRVGIWLQTANCSGDSCNNIQFNNQINGNQIFAYKPTEGYGIKSHATGTIIKNNFAERTIEIAYKDNRIFNNDVFGIIVTTASGSNYALSWNNNIRGDFGYSGNAWWVTGGGRMDLNSFPDIGNHYTIFDSTLEGCYDNTYDNICDNSYGSDDYPWNIPNGWLIEIATEGDITKEATSPNGASVNFSVSATNDGTPTTVSCNPSPNTQFSIGDTEVVCITPENRVTSFIVTVEDTTSPIITVPSDLELDADTGKGTIVDYGTVSVVDTVDQNVSVSCTPENDSLFPIGENTVTCTATDTNGNTSQESFIVNIVTNVPLPIVNVPNDIVVDANAESGTYVEYPTVTATDPSGLGLKGEPTCDHLSGNFFYDGTTVVTCTVENNKDFPGTASFTVTVNPFVPPPMVVDAFLPANDNLENGFSISDKQGDQSYTSSGAYIQGFEKTYYRSEGFSGSVTIAVSVWVVLEDTPFQTAEEISLEERDRKYENAKYQTQVGYKNFSPLFFPSECKGIEEDFTYQQRITVYCVKDNSYFRIGALGDLWTMGDDVADIAKAVLKKIDPSFVEEVMDSIPETEIEIETEDEIEIETTTINPEQPIQCAIGTYLINDVCKPRPDLVETSSATITTAEPRIVDANNRYVSVAEIEQPLFVNVEVKNQGDETEDFVVAYRYLASTLGDWSDWTWVSSSINSGKFSDVSVQWKPTIADNYEFDIQIWDNVQEKNILSKERLIISAKTKEVITQQQSTLDLPTKEKPSFVDESKNPQSYIDRYNNEPKYKEWFDSNYPDYTIFEAVGLPEPIKEKVPTWVKNNAAWWAEGNIEDDTFVSGVQFLMKEKIVNIPDLPEQASEKAKPSFVDESKDPQSYIDRYNNEASYKEWFDENYPDYTIEEAVGVTAPIPGWIKNTASWWSEGLISEDEFIKGIEFLVEKRILDVK